MSRSRLVSIIIPTYNRAHLIRETLDSIKNQTYTNWECIIVDDGSADTTEGVVRNYKDEDSRFKYYRRPSYKPKGANACRNFGFEKSKGDYIIFFDSDDIMSEYCLANRVRIIGDLKDYDFVVFSMGHFKSSDNLMLDKHRLVFNNNQQEAIKAFIRGIKLPWNICRPIFRRGIIENVKFNESLLRFQDIDFNLKVLINNSPKFISIDETDCYYRLDNNKYQLKNFKNRMLCSLAVFYTSIISVLKNKNVLDNYKEDLKLNFYNLTLAYYTKGVRFLVFFSSMKILFFNKILSGEDMVLLLVITFFNKFWYMKKGYYTIIRAIKKRKFMNS